MKKRVLFDGINSIFYFKTESVIYVFVNCTPDPVKLELNGIKNFSKNDF